MIESGSESCKRLLVCLVLVCAMLMTAAQAMAREEDPLPTNDPGAPSGSKLGMRTTNAAGEQVFLGQEIFDSYAEPVGYEDAAGNKVVYFYWPGEEAGWDSSEFSDYPSYALKAIEVLRPVFDGLGPTTDQPMWFGMIKNSFERNMAGEDTITDGSYNPNDGMVFFPTNRLAGYLCGHTTIAHEVAHAMAAIYNGAPADDPQWIVEGGAEYLANVVYPEAQNAECFEGRYKTFGASPLSGLWDRDYEAYPFLKWLSENWTDVNKLILGQINGNSSQALIEEFKLDEQWPEYSLDVWGDERYALEAPPYECDKSFPPLHLHFGHPDPSVLSREQVTLIEYLDDVKPYAISYLHFRSQDSDLYRLTMEEVLGSGGNPDLRIGAIVVNLGGYKHVRMSTWPPDPAHFSAIEFANFVPRSGEDLNHIYYHTGNDLVVAVSCVASPPNGNGCSFSSGLSEGTEYWVSIGLPDLWELAEVRVNEGKKDTEQRFNIFGKMELRAYSLDDGRVRIVQKTRHFWPNFKAQYYQDAVEQGPESTGAAFKAGGTLETFVEESCWFLGKQIFEIEDVDSDQWLEDKETWDQRLVYKFKATDDPITINTPHKFRCVPNVATNKMLALLLVPGGAPSAAA